MKIVAYIMYLVAMFASGFILRSAGVGTNTWQFWAIVTLHAVVFTCGYIWGWRSK